MLSRRPGRIRDILAIDVPVAERGAARNTLEAYERDIEDYLEFLGGKAPADAAAEDIRGWLAALAGEGLVNASRARHLSAVRSFFAYLARHHGVENTAVRLATTPRARRPLPRALPADAAIAVTRDIGEMSDHAVVQARDTATRRTSSISRSRSIGFER